MWETLEKTLIEGQLKGNGSLFGDCKSAIPGSNPGGASFVPSITLLGESVPRPGRAFACRPRSVWGFRPSNVAAPCGPSIRPRVCCKAFSMCNFMAASRERKSEGAKEVRPGVPGDRVPGDRATGFTSFVTLSPCHRVTLSSSAPRPPPPCPSPWPFRDFCRCREWRPVRSRRPVHGRCRARRTWPAIAGPPPRESTAACPDACAARTAKWAARAGMSSGRSRNAGS